MSIFLKNFRVYIYVLFFACIFSSQLFAAGITIPANCTLDVAACALIVPGDVNNSGTLITTTGSITVSGNWISSGVFTSGTGTVTFNGTSGTQILNTGGLANAFYNLTHDGASTLSLTPAVADINNNFSNTAGTFQANGLNMTIGKDWLNSATYTPGTNTVTFDGTNQTITGTTTFYNLTKVTAAADTLTFSANGTEEQTVTHLLTLKGAIGQLLSLEKSGANPQAKLKLQTGGAQDMKYLSVHNNNATGMTLVAGLTSTDAGNNTNWSFGNGTFTWDGTVSTDWDDPFNWSGGVVPAPGDSVTIQPVGGSVVYAPILATNVTIANLTLQAGSVVDLNGKNITVTNTFTNSGNVKLKGTETLNLTQDIVNPGTFTYVGTNTGTTITIKDFGATDYYNLTINDTNGSPDTFITNGALTLVNNLSVTAAVLNTSTNSNAVVVGGALTVNGGTWTATNSTIDVNGAVTISSGTLTAPASTTNTAFTVAGNWTHSGGTFTANNGKVTLDGSSQSMAGSTTFYQLRKVVAAASTLTLTAGTTQTISNNLVLNGVAGNVLSIRSSVGGSAANLNLQAGGTQAISYVDVQDNTASGLTLVAVAGGVDTGNNTNWIFGAATMTWTGTVSTDWDTSGNWDIGIVPTSIDNVVIANVANQPVLATNVTIGTLTTNASSNLTLNGKNLSVSGALTNNGTITLFGSETMSFGTMDTAHGTFVYVGNGDGTVDTVTIKDFGATDYYNLTINDTHGTKDVFITNADLTLANNLSVTSSSLNTSTNSNTLTTGGTLTVNGGTLTATNSIIDANGAVVISSGTFNAPAATTNTAFTVAGNWTHSGGTFNNASGKVTFDGTGQTMAGSTTFYRLRKVMAAADTLTLTAGTTQTVSNDLTLSGASGQLLSLRSTSSGSQANISLTAGGTQSINFMDVKDNNASGGVTLVARSSSVDSGNNTNWTFGGATLTWTGTTSTDWDVPTNWDLGIVPNSTDAAVVTNVANLPSLSTNVTLAVLTTNASSTLTLNGKNMTVTGALTNNGTVSLFGSETISFGTMDVAHGTFLFTGNGDGVVDTFTIPDLGATDYYNVVINDTHGTKDLFITNGALTLAHDLSVTSSSLDISTNANTLTTGGTLTINGGTLTATNGNIDANGAVVISSGVLTAPTTAKSFTVAGDWTHSGGTFTTSSGRVTMDTASAALITGNTTFYDWYSTTPAKVITFTAGSNQTVNNIFNFTGAVGSLIQLRSSSSGSSWNITFPNGDQTASLVDVKDSNALTSIVTCLECTDSLNNNTNWLFVSLQLSAPADNRTVGQLPVIIGTGPPNTNVRIKGLNEAGTEVIVATTRANAYGNYRVVLGHDDDTDAGTSVASGVKLRISTVADDNYLTPYVLSSSFVEVPGPQNDLTVVLAPTTSQVPQITSPVNNERIKGDKPVITGVGKPGQAVVVKANDSAGSLLLSSIGSSTTDGTGNYSFAVTTSLLKGTNYVSVVVDGVSSDLISLSLTDPFGYVFDSTTGNVVKDASVAIYRASDNHLAEVSSCDGSGNITVLRDLDCNDTNPFVTGTDGLYSFLAANGNYYIQLSNPDFTYPSVLTTFPVGKVVTTGSKGETFTVNNVILQIDHPVDINRFLLRIEKSANKTEVRIGDVVTYAVTIQNLSSSETINNIVLVDKIPPGFKYLSNRVLLDGIGIADPSGNRPLTFTIGSIGPGITKTLKYQLVVGAGVASGTYENVAQAKYSNGLVISNTTTKSVKVVMDPLFDMGTVIGKVFYDLNENGQQDAPEYDPTEGTTIVERPIPNVQIVTDDGTVITADREGKYSWPGVLPGRHMLRIDERTLPPGSYLTTDKAVVVDVTNGSISKVNFGVNMDNKQVVGKDAVFFNEKIALNQDKNKPAPRLNVAMFSPEEGKETLVIYNNTSLFKPAQFRIFTNYAAFLDSWQLDIIDRDTKKLVKHFTGTRFNIHDPIIWNGRGDDERMIRFDHHYAYVLSVKNEKGERDLTMEKPLEIRVIETEEEYKKEKDKETRSDWGKQQADNYRKWVDTQSAVNALEKQGITIAGETIHINRQGQDIKSVRVLKGGAVFADIPLEQYYGLTPKEMLDAGITAADKTDNIEIILPNGDYNLEVIGPQDKGEIVPPNPLDQISPPAITPSLTPVPLSLPPTVGLERYTRPIKVGDDYFMFVGLGDAKVGYNFNRGNVEPIQSSDHFQNKFWHQGKASYYLKGKIMGKYLVTSSFDTDRQQKELYRKLDPATYYPIYGDKSSINYDATDTQGPLYLMVQWDKSQAVWGNYAVDFNNTEFANFTRSFYGGKLDYQSVANNPYGDARTKVVLFHAEIQQRPSHNEFLGTGGSLYFLKNKDVVQSTDKIRIEVRDKVTGLVLSSKEMKNGADYELDEGQGRILFWQPVSMIAKSESIVSTDLIDGNPIYVVADYEYYVQDKLTESSEGARVAQAVGDNVVIGGTYVKETQTNKNFEMKGTDVTAHLGPDATVKAEYAQTQSLGVSSYVSTDGGISFTQLQSGDAANGVAYGIKGDARLFNRLGVASYYKWIEDSFTSVQSSSQQGKQLAGLALTFDLTPLTRVTARTDIQKLINNANLQTVAQVGASETSTTLVQVVHESERLKLTGAYQIQEVKNKIGDLVTTTNQVTKSLAGKAEYALNGRVTLTAGQQFDISNANNNITTIGAQGRVTDRLKISAQEAFSKAGTATTFGVSQNVTDKLALSTAYTLTQLATGESAKTTTFGAKQDINDKVSATASVSSTDSSTGTKTTSGTVGTSARINEQTVVDALVGKSAAANGQTVTTATVAATTGVIDKDTTIKTAVSMNQGTTSTIGLQGLTNTSTTASNSISVEANKRVNDNLTTASSVKVDDNAQGGKTTTIAVSQQAKINDRLQAVSERSFGITPTGTTSNSKYALAKEQDGRKVEASLTRAVGDQSGAVSQSNIFGLTGDVNDKLALLGSLEKGKVQNLDGSKTDRTAIALGAGYVWKDPELAMERLKDSAKVEFRFDEGNENKRQYVFYNALEGKITDNMSVSAKLEYSKTENVTTSAIEERHKQVILGASYRPVNFDRLNMIGQYAYKENAGPVGQSAGAVTDVAQSRTQVFGVEGVYDVNDAWQLAEKFAFRINDEKVTGFEFNRTHTWLMIHRINYKVDRDWTLSTELRNLTQVEAKDSKQGLLMEATRNINDYAQLGLGWNFTQFNDDLTNLNYTSQGPFLRMSGKLYDRSPEEKQRAKEKWLDNKVAEWAWAMVSRELQKPDSKVVVDLNHMFVLASAAQKASKFEESQQIYKDIIIAGQMMFDEASEFIRGKIAFEEKLQEYNKTAQDYYVTGEYVKARKLWEKIVADAQKGVLE